MRLPVTSFTAHSRGEGIAHRWGYDSRQAKGFGSLLTDELGTGTSQTASGSKATGITSARTQTAVAGSVSQAQVHPSTQSVVISTATAQSIPASAQASRSTACTTGRTDSVNHGQNGRRYVALSDGVTPAPVQPANLNDPQETFAFFNGVRYYRIPQGSGPDVMIQADLRRQIVHQLAVNELDAAAQTNFQCCGGPGGIPTPTAIPAFMAILNDLPTSLDAVPTVDELVNVLTQNGYTKKVDS